MPRLTAPHGLQAASDLDVALPDGTGDDAYLGALAAHLPQAIERARADAVVYLAGAEWVTGVALEVDGGLGLGVSKF